MENGIHFNIHMPMEERIQNIMNDYEPENHQGEFLESFQYIKKRIHIPIA